MVARNQFQAIVLHNIPLCREHYRLVLRVDYFPKTEPGQFIQISCRDADSIYHAEREVTWQDRYPTQQAAHAPELMQPVALLRRPFSLAGRRDTPAGVELDIIHRVIGVGTAWLAQLSAGERVDILGPLGNSFDLPPEGGLGLLVGGGVGIPPMLYLAQGFEHRRAIAFCGATTRELLPLSIRDGSPGQSNAATPGMVVEDFARHGIPAVVSTDDGSYGFRGFVTQALEKWLQINQTDGSTVVYTCGPEPMMKRVAGIAARHGLQCQVAVERAMACGMGTCQSCCIRVRKSDPARPPLIGSDWCWRLACTDGPVFRGAELLW